MSVIRFGNITAVAERIAATFRSRRDSLLGAVSVEIHPADDMRDGGGPTNTEVLARLATRHPELVTVDDDALAAARAAAHLVWNPRTSGLRDIALAAGIGFAHAVANRLRSGAYVTNTAETSRRKARAGLSTTPGVATGQLADALDSATTTLTGGS